MPVLTFNFIYLLFVFLMPQNGTGSQEITVQEGNKEYSKRKYEIDTYSAIPITPTPNDNLYRYQNSEQIEKKGSSKKRQAILPGLFKSSLGTDIVVPTGINAQLGPKINLGIDQGIVPNLKEQGNAISGALNIAAYPIQLFVLNPKDNNNNLNDLKTVKIPLIIVNSTSNNSYINNDMYTSKSNNLENVQNLFSVVRNPINKIIDANSINKSHDIINNTVPQIIQENRLNVKVLNNSKLLNSQGSNNTNNSLSIHNDDYFLKNHTHNKLNETYSVTLLSNRSNTENIGGEDNSTPLLAVLEPFKESSIFNGSNRIVSHISSTYDNNEKNDNTIETTVKGDNCNLEKTDDESKSSPSLIEVKETALFDNYKTEPIGKPTKHLPLEKAKPVNSQNTTTRQNKETENESGNYESNSEGNNAGLLSNEEGMNIVSYNKPDFEYSFESQNIDTCQHQNIESIPKLNMAGSKSNILKDVYNENGINDIQEYAIIRPSFKYPIRDQNIFANQYQKPESILEKHEAYSKRNDLKYVYNDNRNDIENTNTRSKFKYPMKDENTNLYQYQILTTIPVRVYNENRNNVIQEHKNIGLEFKYPFEDQNTNIYHYRKLDTTPEYYEAYNDGKDLIHIYEDDNRNNIGYINIKPVFKDTVEYQNTNTYQYQNPQSVPLLVHNENRNNIVQSHRNIQPEYLYPFKHQNKNTNQYEKPNILAEIHRIGSNFNDMKVTHNKQNNNASNISKNLKLYYTNNKPSYIKVNLDYGNSAKPKRIQCHCNQRSPLINCNGFYRNQNSLITYPSYLYYPYVYSQ